MNQDVSTLTSSQWFLCLEMESIGKAFSSALGSWRRSALLPFPTWTRQQPSCNQGRASRWGSCALHWSSWLAACLQTRASTRCSFTRPQREAFLGVFSALQAHCSPHSCSSLMRSLRASQTLILLSFSKVWLIVITYFLATQTTV